MFLIGFPLLLVPFAIYNIVAFLMPGVSWTGTLATVHMMSGADWAMSGGDVLVTLAILLLFVEMMKAARIGRRGISSTTVCRCCCSSACWPNSCWCDRRRARPSFCFWS